MYMTTQGDMTYPLQGPIDCREIERRMHGSPIKAVPADLRIEIDRARASSPTDGWGVYGVSSSIESQVNLDKNLNIIDAYGKRLRRHMLEMGYGDDAVEVATGWLLRRFRDRFKINAATYEGRLFDVPEEYRDLECRRVDGTANMAQRAILMYLTGSLTEELGRVTAPSVRDESVLIEVEEAAIETIELLGGKISPQHQPEKKEIAYGAYVGSETLLRVHEKKILGTLSNGAVIARRLAGVALLDGLHSLPIEPTLKPNELLRAAADISIQDATSQLIKGYIRAPRRVYQSSIVYAYYPGGKSQRDLQYENEVPIWDTEKWPSS